MADDKKQCFIITPIGGDNDPIRRHIEGIIDAVIVPALGEKYNIVVAHRIYEPGLITQQVIGEVCKADLVIANLTNRNPNVMYELSFRHSLGKPAITIAEKGTQLPSDIVMERTIFYENDAKGVLELREKIVSAENEIDFSKKAGPIYDVLAQINAEDQVLDGLRKEKSDKETDAFDLIIRKLNSMEQDIKKIKEDTRNELPYISSADFNSMKNDYNFMRGINEIKVSDEVRKILTKEYDINHIDPINQK